MPASYVALLRGINVGGKNKIPMNGLAELFGEAGCRAVQTYIQSGNVMFDADPGLVATLPAALTARIAERFACRVPVVLRTAADLGAVLAGNPFLGEGVGIEALHVLFLADEPSARAVAALDPDRSPPDAFRVRGREVYLHLPNGAGRTKLTNDYFDTKLGTISTGRNWRTVAAIFELMRR